MKSVTTKTYTTLLLALLAALWSTNAWAAVTVNVKAPSAPHIYAWDANQNKLTTNAFPGDEMADTKTVYGVTYYTKTFENETSINLLFTNNGQQTSDFSNITGEVYFNYDGSTKAYGKIPSSIAYESGNIAYFVNTKNWDKVCAYVFNGDSNNDWPGPEISQLTTDGANQGVYKFGPFTNFNPTKIIFSNGSGKQTPDLDFTQGGYYVYGEYDNGNSTRADLVATIDASRISNTATYFADKHFREAITKNLGVNEGAAFTPSDVTVLDLSYDANVMTGKISSINTPSGGGIDYFTNLKELYLNDNDLQYLKLTKNSSLEILEMRNNPTIVGFTANASTVETNHAIIMPPSANKPPLKRLDASGCTNLGWFQAINGTYGINTLEWLSLNSCPLDGWSTGISAQTGLKYLDLTNTGMTSAITVAALTELDTLIVANNPNIGSSYINMTHCNKLRYFDLTNTGLTTDNAKTTLNTVALSNLETLKISGNTSMRYAYTTTLSSLKHFEIADGDLYFTPTYQLSTLTPTNNPNLEYLDISNAKISSSANPIDGFQNLKTVIAGSNPNMPKLTINNCPAIENIDISNNTSETILSITNSGLTSIPSINATGTTSLYKLDLTGNAFTDVPTTGIASLTTLVMNYNRLSDLNVSESNIHYLYAQRNNFGSGEYEMPETSLVGLDLGNNGFTKFKMTGNTTLKSLALSGNDALTEIELHGNTQLTQTSPDGVIESDNGLYIKGLSSLQTLNIENSSFNKLGQQNSLQGVTGLTKLQARNNKFTTFTNGVNPVGVTGTGSYRIADPTESSLEHLTALEYLDLAYNELSDSVHLYKNVALKHLDVSHNNHITGVYDGSITTEAQKTAMLEKKARHLMKYGNVYGAVGTNATADQWKQGYTDFQKLRSRPFDLRTEDLNDTTGLYHLDLGQNVNLEWLDFSYTNIHNTASKPEMMNTGWINKDWVTDMGTFEAVSSVNTTSKRAYTSWHTYVYFIPCSKLKVIHADHNNMQSLGIRYFPELDTLTCSYMYGDCAYMRDFSSNSALSVGTNAISDEDVLIGMGNISLSTTVQKLKSVTWSTDKNGNPTSTLTWEGSDGTANTYYCNPIKYYDVSYSGFNEIRFYPGSYFTDLPNLEYVNVSGNPLNFQVKHYNGATLLDYSNVSNYNSLDLTYCPNIKTVLADNCSYLPTVRAYNRDALTTLDLTNDPQLKTVYVQDNEVLPSITGLSTLTGLETLFAYNNPQFRGIDVSYNTALKNLWVSRIGANSLDVSNNTGLLKLRAYDNSLTTLNVGANTALTWLDVARNQIPILDLSTNAALQYFNCSNSVETLDDQSLAANNHNGGEADEVKPVTGNHSADDSGNSLSDLVFNTEAPIADVRANSNDLHKITGSFGNLTHIEFAHNHINGIDLSAATGLTPADVIDEDNGRAITAECSKFYKNGDMNNAYTIYYFQLDPNAPAQHGGELLTNKTSIDSKDMLRIVGDDGLVLDNIDTWGGSNGNSGKLTMDVTVTPGNMGDYLSADDVIGTIVVLDPEKVTTAGAEGHATYTYKNGVSDSSTEDTSEFYLDWSSDGTVTGIDGVKVVDGVSVAGSYGQLTVTGADGTAIGVYDMNGRQVSNATITGGHATVTGLAPGIYLVNGQRVLVR